MNIGEVSSAATASSFSVKVFNGAREQQEAVVGKLLESVEASAPPAHPGKGSHVNVIA